MANAKKKQTKNHDGAPPAFEDALSDLEAIIMRLEREDLTLEQSLAHFEEGVRLMRHCDGHLKSARGRLIELSKGENGKFVAEVLGEGLEMFSGENNKGDTDNE